MLCVSSSPACNQAKVQAAEAEEAVAAVNAATIATKRQLADTQHQLKATQEQLQHASETTECHAAALSELENELSRIRAELAASRAEAAAYVQRANAAEEAAEQLRELQPQVAALRARAARAEASAVCCERQRQLLESRATELSVELVAARRLFAGVRAENERAQGQLLGIREEVTAWAAGDLGGGDGSSSDECGDEWAGGGGEECAGGFVGGRGAGGMPGGAVGAQLQGPGALASAREQVLLLQVGTEWCVGCCSRSLQWGWATHASCLPCSTHSGCVVADTQTVGYSCILEAHGQNSSVTARPKSVYLSAPWPSNTNRLAFTPHLTNAHTPFAFF